MKVWITMGPWGESVDAVFATRESALASRTAEFEAQWAEANNPEAERYSHVWAVQWRAIGREAAYAEWAQWVAEEHEVHP